MNFLLEATNNATAGNTWWIYVVLIVLVVIMLVVPTITNRRRMKEYNQMVDRLRVGDEVRTIGGVVGRVMKITKKDSGTTFILETGSKGSKTTMEFDINAVGTVLTSTYVEEETKEAAKQEETKDAKKPEEATEAAVEEKKEEAASDSSSVESIESRVVSGGGSGKRRKR